MSLCVASTSSSIWLAAISKLKSTLFLTKVALGHPLEWRCSSGARAFKGNVTVSPQAVQFTNGQSCSKICSMYCCVSPSINLPWHATSVRSKSTQIRRVWSSAGVGPRRNFLLTSFFLEITSHTVRGMYYESGFELGQVSLNLHYKYDKMLQQRAKKISS